MYPTAMLAASPTPAFILRFLESSLRLSSSYESCSEHQSVSTRASTCSRWISFPYSLAALRRALVDYDDSKHQDQMRLQLVCDLTHCCTARPASHCYSPLRSFIHHFVIDEGHGLFVDSAKVYFRHLHNKFEAEIFIRDLPLCINILPIELMRQ